MKKLLFPAQDFLETDLIIAEKRLLICPHTCSIPATFLNRLVTKEYSRCSAKEHFYKEFFSRIKKEFKQNLALNYKLL